MQLTHCPECGCRVDDHTNREEVGDGIPWQRVGAGVSEPDDIITCGDCADCRVDPTLFDQVRTLIESIY